jgi:hypothetical protein
MDCDASPVSYHRKGLQITKGDRLGTTKILQYFLVSRNFRFLGQYWDELVRCTYKLLIISRVVNVTNSKLTHAHTDTHTAHHSCTKDEKFAEGLMAESVAI